MRCRIFPVEAQAEARAAAGESTEPWTKRTKRKQVSQNEVNIANLAFAK